MSDSYAIHPPQTTRRVPSARHNRFCGSLAQLVERFPYTEDVGGSSPSGLTTFSMDCLAPPQSTRHRAGRTLVHTPERSPILTTQRRFLMKEHIDQVLRTSAKYLSLPQGK